MPAVIFWNYYDGRPQAVPLFRAAEELDVDLWSLHELFKGWTEAGCPPIHRLKLEEKRYLELFMVEGDLRGWVHLVRPWGKCWRRLPGRGRYFTLEVSVEGPEKEASG